MSIASTSLTAYRSLDLNELEQLVFDVIESYGAAGCISDDVRAHCPHLSYSSVTARFSSLEEKGCIYRVGDTRPGRSGRPQKVMRSTIHMSAVPVLPLVKKMNPYVKGFMAAAKIVLKQSDLASAKKALALELKKAVSK